MALYILNQHADQKVWEEANLKFIVDDNEAPIVRALLGKKLTDNELSSLMTNPEYLKLICKSNNNDVKKGIFDKVFQDINDIDDKTGKVRGINSIPLLVIIAQQASESQLLTAVANNKNADNADVLTAIVGNKNSSIYTLNAVASKKALDDIDVLKAFILRKANISTNDKMIEVEVNLAIRNNNHVSAKTILALARDSDIKANEKAKVVLRSFNNASGVQDQINRIFAEHSVDQAGALPPSAGQPQGSARAAAPQAPQQMSNAFQDAKGKLENYVKSRLKEGQYEAYIAMPDIAFIKKFKAATPLRTPEFFGKPLEFGRSRNVDLTKKKVDRAINLMSKLDRGVEIIDVYKRFLYEKEFNDKNENFFSSLRSGYGNALNECMKNIREHNANIEFPDKLTEEDRKKFAMEDSSVPRAPSAS